MKRMSPSSPYSWMRQTLRWPILRASLISETNRRDISGSRMYSLRSTFSATCSSITRSRPCRRGPFPPGRAGCTISYRPDRTWPWVSAKTAMPHWKQASASSSISDWQDGHNMVVAAAEPAG